MNDQPPPPSDEDLSAALDGEAGPEAQARVDADPTSAERSAELAGAAAFLRSGETPSLDTGTVDQLVRAALDAPVAPDRPTRRSQPPGWLVAAVVAVLVAVGLTLVWTGRDQADDTALDTATEVAQSSDGEAFDQAAPQVDAAGALDSEESTADAQPLPDLGAFGSGDELRRALATTELALASGGRATTRAATDPAAVARCAEQLQVVLDLPEPPQSQAQATVDGTVVLVYEFAIESFEDASPTTLVAAVDATSCGEVVVFER